MDRTRRDVLQQVSQVAFAGTIIPIQSVEVQADDSRVNTSKVNMFEVGMKMKSGSDIGHQYASCIDFPPYYIQSMTRSEPRVLLSNTQIDNQSTIEHPMVAGYSHYIDSTMENELKFDLPDVPIRVLPGSGGLWLSKSKLLEAIKLRAAPGAAVIQIGDTEYSITKGKSKSIQTPLEIRSKGAKKTVEMDFTIKHHGIIKSYNHPDHILLPESAKANRMSKTISKGNKGENMQNNSRRVTYHKDLNIISVPIAGMGGE